MYIPLLQVCDSNLKIRNVNAKFGGATHDSFIWASSSIESFLRALHQSGEQVWLLGKCRLMFDIIMYCFKGCIARSEVLL